MPHLRPSSPSRVLLPGARNLAALVAVALAVGVLGPASAHTKRIGAKHTIGFTGDASGGTFRGRLNSAVAACERRRTVRVMRVIGGAATPDVRVAKVTTNRRGRWTKSVASLTPGAHYALAPKKVIRKPGHRHICKAARSPNVSVAAPPPADSDGDGIPDAEDCDPAQPNQPGDCVVTTPYEINQGLIALGTQVRIDDVFVSGVTDDAATAFVQSLNYGEQLENSALEVDLDTLSAPTDGDVIQLHATVVSNDAVTALAIDTVSTGYPVSPHQTTVTELLASAAGLDAVIVAVSALSLESHDGDDWIMAEGIGVSGEGVGTLPTRVNGSWFTKITGIVDASDPPSLMPRFLEDIEEPTDADGTESEVDSCRLQFPLSMLGTEAEASDTVFGRLFHEGLTEAAGGPPEDSVMAQLGVGPDGSDPATHGTWSWVSASLNPAFDPIGQGAPNDDEYMGSFIVPAAPGSPYDYAYRFSIDDGASFTYCDGDLEGSTDGYSAAEAGNLTVSA